MRLDVHELYKSENIRLPSPGQCIYCGNSKSNLRHEHVIPYALAANTMILEKSCCETCQNRSEEHTSELQSLMRISYAVFCLKKKKKNKTTKTHTTHNRYNRTTKKTTHYIQ